MTEILGNVFNIERNSFVDGPGIRTTVFLKGCNLRCVWCHNPEGQNRKREIMFYEKKCIHCGKCENLTTEDYSFICPNEAKEICGVDYTPRALMKEILKDKLFFSASGGGVTFSGGECMLQIDFLEEVLKLCRKECIHTAVDTAGHVPYSCFERIIPYTDLFLYDVKCLDSEMHKRYTGVGNELILDNLKKLLTQGRDVWIRTPIIPGVNDSNEEIDGIKRLVLSYGEPKKFETLPYHSMGEHKYAALGRRYMPFLK